MELSLQELGEGILDAIVGGAFCGFLYYLFNVLAGF